jgi:hypothetical protein
MNDAATMFDKIGFRQTENDHNYISYRNKNGSNITFYLEDNSYMFHKRGNDYNSPVTMDEHMAIHQQMVENMDGKSRR